MSGEGLELRKVIRVNRVATLCGSLQCVSFIFCPFCIISTSHTQLDQGKERDGKTNVTQSALGFKSAHREWKVGE